MRTTPVSAANATLRPVSRHESPEHPDPSRSRRHPRLLIRSAQALLGEADGTARVRLFAWRRMGRRGVVGRCRREIVAALLTEHSFILILAHGLIRLTEWRRQKRRSVGNPTVSRDW